MPRRIVTISYTALDAGGGVPKFNRDLHAAFPDRECRHFCWQDFPWYIEVDEQGETEWGRARRLNEYLLRSRLVTTGDVVIADGFWADGLELLPRAISHSHGIWSHLTKEDVDDGKSPDMPLHHAAQVAFRQRWTKSRKYLTAVSDFIAEQMRMQWGFRVHRVINNGVDTDRWKPHGMAGVGRSSPLIVHGVNDASNVNKGWDHIQHLKDNLREATVVSLDQLCAMNGVRSGHPTKEQCLAEADLVVHPSGYEGNSMFVAEALACGVPIVAYDVGFLWTARDAGIGNVIPRSVRDPELFTRCVTDLLKDFDDTIPRCNPVLAECGRRARELAVSKLSITRFRQEWRDFVESIEAK